MVEYYKGDEWKAINNALQGGLQAVWLIGSVGIWTGHVLGRDSLGQSQTLDKKV